MFTLKKASVLLALVGSAFAAPLARRDGQRTGRLDTNFGYEINGNQVFPVDGIPAGAELVGYTVVTIYPGSTPTATYNAPAHTNTVVATTTTAASTSSGSSSSSGDNTPTTGGGLGDYMAVVNKWRKAGGLSALTQSTKLEGNAQKTVNDDNGVMSHELNAGSMAQVLAPGQTSDFEHVYVGGWLCEISSLPGLNGICATQGQGWSHNGETGHADILTSTKYTQIGCAWATGIWGCDLA